VVIDTNNHRIPQAPSPDLSHLSTANCRVCTIGGGSGMPVVNRALVRAGYRRIHAIVTMFDSGGDTGRMRTDERGQILAYSDYWRALMSLWSDGQHKLAWEEVLLFRDDRGRSFGNTFLRFLADKTGDLRAVDTLFSQLTGAELCGEVVPVSMQPAELCFQTETGRAYRGEHHLDELRMSSDRVLQIWLEPQVSASDEALEALTRADLIVVAPGSLYGSILVNFLPQGMRAAFLESSAFKLLLTNIMSVANETGPCTQRDYVACFERQLQAQQPFDLVVAPDLSALDEAALQQAQRYYEMEHAHPVRFDASAPGPYRLADLALIEGTYGRLRHCEDKLARFFGDLALSVTRHKRPQVDTGRKDYLGLTMEG
jgi:uncharacterized cofD-like protein